ncbi:MAG: GNAT family N-acetyltransferase [Rhodospirillaceae bacterium]|nr:GNAT family N-acetyltransferase [Rhodospirillaceae bacterium]|tara:strand:+ start:2972 stop:4144 length:1173 start_codon:yes stop_codon:yes gene_type:complete
MATKVTRNDHPQRLRLIGSINEVSKDQWDSCAGEENPFLSHDFLSILEDSGSVCAKTGWLPQHLVYEDRNGTLLGAVPLYLKGHSYGEYVFDWGWADAFERAGHQYFPKLLSAVPFTPVTCSKLLTRPGENRSKLNQILIAGLVSATEQLKVSSLHVNFLLPNESELLGRTKFLTRNGLQYHWCNANYASFDEFLSHLNSRKRKNIRKERRAAAAHGVTISALTAEEIEERHWDAFYSFYIDTSDRKWGGAYLNKQFFRLLGKKMADKVLLIMAEYDGVPVGGALNFIGKDTLYGRNWGCTSDFKFLHFEACYYQAIDFAIKKGLRRVEAGAQGNHKFQRGYLPKLTHSSHYIVDAGFREAVAEFLMKEREHIVLERNALEKMSPFKQES